MEFISSQEVWFRSCHLLKIYKRQRQSRLTLIRINKILKNAIQNDIYYHNNRKFSTITKSSKGSFSNFDIQEHCLKRPVKQQQITATTQMTPLRGINEAEVTLRSCMT